MHGLMNEKNKLQTNIEGEKAKDTGRLDSWMVGRTEDRKIIVELKW